MSEYNIQMNKYNASKAGYDQLYPVTKIEDVDGLDTALQKKADVSSVYTKEESISAETRTALGLAETATPDDALAELTRQFSERAVLLWENASPASEFAAQSLSPTGMENLQDGDLIAIETNNGVFWNSWSPTTSHWCYSMNFSSYNSSLKVVEGRIRTFVVRPGSIEFSDCNNWTSAGYSATTNNMFIPLRIYRIRLG